MLSTSHLYNAMPVIGIISPFLNMFFWSLIKSIVGYQKLEKEAFLWEIYEE